MKQDYQWLEGYAQTLLGQHVLELGSGSGIDTKVILKHANSVIATDLYPNQNTQIRAIALDHSKPLPFKNRQFDVVVASLCLHYFPRKTTQAIFEEIARVLKPDGTLICRVNSYQDAKHGAVGFPVIEPGLLNVNGKPKRFFRAAEIRELLGGFFIINSMEHRTIDRYQSPKCVYEFSARPIKR